MTLQVQALATGPSVSQVYVPSSRLFDEPAGQHKRLERAQLRGHSRLGRHSREERFTPTRAAQYRNLSSGGD
jgi:hypothetical protein